MQKRGVLPRQSFPSKWLSLQFLGLGVDSLGDDRTLVLGVCVGLRVSLLGVSSALDIPWGSNSLLSESMKVYCKCVCLFVHTCMYVFERMKLFRQVRELQHQLVHHYFLDSLQSTHKLRVKMKAVGVGLYDLLSYEYYYIVSGKHLSLLKWPPSNFDSFVVFRGCPCNHPLC